MLLGFLRKQAFPVVVLVGCVAGMIFLNREQKKELKEEVAALRVELLECSKSHEADSKTITDLKVEQAMLKERVNILSGIGTAPRRR